MPDTASHPRIVAYYAAWAAICAALAGLLMAVIHTLFFSAPGEGSTAWGTLLAGAGTALAIAAGQGLVALLTGSLLARAGRALRYTVLLGLALGAFDFAMYLLQTTVPATELGWGPDIAILLGAAASITAAGARRDSAP